MGLRERLEAIGIGWSWPLAWTGAENDLCLKPDCGVKRSDHVKLDHHFQEEK